MGFHERYNAIVHGVSNNINKDVLEIKPNGISAIEQRLPEYARVLTNERKNYIDGFNTKGSFTGSVFRQAGEKFKKLAFGNVLELSGRVNLPIEVSHNELRALRFIHELGKEWRGRGVDLVFLSLREMSLEYSELRRAVRLGKNYGDPKNKDIKMVGWIAGKFGFQGFESAEKIKEELKNKKVDTSQLSYVDCAWTLFQRKLDAVRTETDERPVAVLILDTDITSAGFDPKEKKHAVLKRMEDHLTELANGGQLGLLKRDYNY